MYEHQPKYVSGIALKRDKETYQHELGQSMAIACIAAQFVVGKSARSLIYPSYRKVCFPIRNHK